MGIQLPRFIGSPVILSHGQVKRDQGLQASNRQSQQADGQWRDADSGAFLERISRSLMGDEGSKADKEMSQSKPRDIDHKPLRQPVGWELNEDQMAEAGPPVVMLSVNGKNQCAAGAWLVASCK